MAPGSLRGFFWILALVVGLAAPVSAYEVEAGSVGNTVYVLLLNEQPSASFDSVSVGEDLPGFVPTASASLVPASIPAQGSDLVAVTFDVTAAVAPGSTGELTLTVSGTLSGQSVDLQLPVALTVVGAAPVAQGVVGVGVPAPDPGGVDTDGDGVTDALEIAFGSDPNNASSLPGDPAALPGLGAPGLVLLAVLSMLVAGAWTVRRERSRAC